MYNYVRIAPRKVGVVLDLIRGKDLETAMAIVRNTPKAASEPIGKLLKSAAANAENNFSMNRDALYVAQALVSPGPTLKRVMPRAQGQGVSDQQENFPHHRCARRERIGGGFTNGTESAIPTV